jgi:hypothetical protein
MRPGPAARAFRDRSRVPAATGSTWGRYAEHHRRRGIATDGHLTPYRRSARGNGRRARSAHSLPHRARRRAERGSRSAKRPRVDPAAGRTEPRLPRRCPPWSAPWGREPLPVRHADGKTHLTWGGSGSWPWKALLPEGFLVALRGDSLVTKAGGTWADAAKTAIWRRSNGLQSPATRRWRTLTLVWPRPTVLVEHLRCNSVKPPWWITAG